MSRRKTKVQGVSGFQERLSSVPQQYRSLFRTIYENKAGKSLKPQRIKAKCLDCCCYQRTEVRDCTAQFCPLWAVRPYQSKPVKA